MNLKPPPETDNYEDLRKWCVELYEFIKYPMFPAGIVGVEESITADASVLRTYGASKLDSTSNKVDSTLADGSRVGDIKVIVMTEASNSSTVTIAHHQTEDAEVATFDAIDEVGVFMWSGTEWITIFATCMSVNYGNVEHGQPQSWEPDISRHCGYRGKLSRIT